MFQTAMSEVNRMTERELVEWIDTCKDKVEDAFIRVKVGCALLRMNLLNEALPYLEKAGVAEEMGEQIHFMGLFLRNDGFGNYYVEENNGSNGCCCCCGGVLGLYAIDMYCGTNLCQGISDCIGPCC